MRHAERLSSLSLLVIMHYYVRHDSDLPDVRHLQRERGARAIRQLRPVVVHVR